MALLRGRVPGRPEAASGLERLWAPWRSAYLAAAGRRSARCIFCFGRINGQARRRRLVLYAGPLALVMLNRYPYNNGHLMIAARRHLAAPELLSREERAVTAELVALAIVRLKSALKPAGFKRRRQPGQYRRGGIRGPFALACRPPLGGRCQLHAGNRINPRALAASGGKFQSARAAFQSH